MLDFLKKAICYLFDHRWVKAGYTRVACVRCGCTGQLLPLIPATDPVRLR